MLPLSEFHTKCAFTLGRECEGHTMHRWWAFTPPVWCEFRGFSRYNIYSEYYNGERVNLILSLDGYCYYKFCRYKVLNF